ncbi:MAG: LysR family transcriptional regulator [Umezawaea sp.]
MVAAGSFAAAARTLGYTASAVSQQVSALERAVGVELFEREAHSIRPSAAALFIAERRRRTTGRPGRLRTGGPGNGPGPPRPPPPGHVPHRKRPLGATRRREADP